jgi:STE24 endopeptidase
MNPYAIIILSTLLFEYLLSLIANLLNLKALSGELPEEFTGVYDAGAYRKSQEYTRANTRFGFLISSLQLSLTLAFWFGGGFNFLDSIVRSWNLNPILSGLAYLGLLMLGLGILSLPVSIYSTFVIEERFGFNKTTPATFIADLFKGLALAVLLGGPLLAGLLALFQYAGAIAWLYCWIAVTLFSLFVQFIAPTWIMPLFNKFKPIEEGELKERIWAYAKSVRFPLSGIFVIDGSRRSSKSNAFFTGFGKTKRIALYDTLVEKHSVAELVAVLAHEIGHYKKKHVLKGLAVSIVHTGVIFFLLSLFLSHEGLFKAFYMERASIYAGFVFFGMLYAPIELALSIFMSLFSRRHEYQADRFAVETTEDASAMIVALKKLSLNNLSNLRPHPFYAFLYYGHPPVLERIEAMKAIEAMLKQAI